MLHEGGLEHEVLPDELVNILLPFHHSLTPTPFPNDEECFGEQLNLQGGAATGVE